MIGISRRVHFVVSVSKRKWVFGLEVNAHHWPYLTIAFLCFDVRIIQRPRTRDDQGKIVYPQGLVTWGGVW